MSAYTRAAGWVVTTLLADDDVSEAVGDRIYEGMPPPHPTYPFILVVPYTDPVGTSTAAGHYLSVLELVVRVWNSVDDSQGRGSLADISTIDANMDALLHDAVNRTGGISWCRRTNEMPVVQVRDEATDRALGGRYEITVSAG
jgi:hypothetical protein